MRALVWVPPALHRLTCVKWQHVTLEASFQHVLSDITRLGEANYHVTRTFRETQGEVYTGTNHSFPSINLAAMSMIHLENEPPSHTRSQTIANIYPGQYLN